MSLAVEFKSINAFAGFYGSCLLDKKNPSKMIIKINIEKYISQIDLKNVNATWKLAEYATCKIPLYSI